MLLQELITNETDLQVEEAPDAEQREQFAALNEEVFRLDVTNRAQVYDDSFLAVWIAMSNQSPDDFE